MNALQLAQIFWLLVLVLVGFAAGTIFGFVFISYKMGQPGFWSAFVRTTSLSTKRMITNALLADPDLHREYFCRSTCGEGDTP